MNNQTIEAAGDAINRVLKDQLIQPGDMIQYLEARHQSLIVAGSDLNHEMSIPELRSFEPGFYEKLFAELDAEVEMIDSIITNLNVNAQLTLEGVITFLKDVQQITTNDIATFHKELDGHQSRYPKFVRHTNEMLARTQRQHECLDVVIATLKEELEWEECEVYEAKPQEEMERIVKERPTECADVEDMLAAIRKRRDELKAAE